MNARILILAALAAPLAAQAQVAIESPWARATAPGMTVAGGYMRIVNRGAAPDRLVGASSPAATRVETHVHVMQGEVMQMREVTGYEVPAKGSFELKPGGAHLMFTDLRRPFKEGDRIPVTLRFEHAGEVKVEFHVGRIGATSAQGR